MTRRPRRQTSFNCTSSSYFSHRDQFTQSVEVSPGSGRTPRRGFLKALAALGAGVAIPSNYPLMAINDKRQVKIRDIKVMVLQGPRTYTLVKVESDAGLFGIGEAYGSPGVGVKEQVLALKPALIGADPLEIDRLNVGLGTRTDGSAHSLMRAVSGIEMALWDLAGKILGVPAYKLLGGKFRDRVRVYDHSAPRDMMDPKSCRDWAQQVRAQPSGFTAHKFGFPHTDPKSDKARDPSNRVLTTTELSRIRKGFENCREALGWDHDLMVHCHWEYDLRTSIQLAEAVAPIQPLWLEDPLPVAYTESWRRLVGASPVPIATGENWWRRQDALPFVINHGCDILHPDLRNSGGFLENKRMADLADLFSLPMASHNTGSVVNTMATAHWAASIRDYLACETVVGKGDWMDDVILHNGPVIKDGFIEISDRPGLGIELNPEVLKSHLAAGEVYWG